MGSADATLAGRLNYAQCWEDTRVLSEALHVGPGKRILSIASGGDNAIALAIAGAEVVAIDLSFSQLAVVELKLAGRGLSYRQYRQLLGVDRGLDPVALYRRVRGLLTEPAANWWDAHPEVLRSGVLGAGRFEKYLTMFRTWLLPLIHSSTLALELFEIDDKGTAKAFYGERWNSRRWRLLFRLFFSRRVMAARGRSPEHFAHVDGPVSSALLKRVEKLFTEVPLRDNGYAQWLLTGTWQRDEALPLYLTKAGHAGLEAAAERIQLVHGSLQDFVGSDGAGTFDGFNLSDVFEYMSEAEAASLYGMLLRSANPGARFAYWNLFAPRSRPAEFRDRVDIDHVAAGNLFAKDRFVYGAFHVEVVK